MSNLGNVAKGALQFEMKPVLLERGDEVGDIARAILYMHTVYSLPYPYISTMREWSIKYKPQEDEIHHYKKVISQTNQNNILINKYYLSRFII